MCMFVVASCQSTPRSTNAGSFKVKIIKALADTLGGLIIDIDIDIDETINEADNDEAVTETPDHMMYM